MSSLSTINGKYLLAVLFCLAAAGQIFALQTGKKYNFRFKDGQHLRNAILLEETETTYRVRLEYISDEKILDKKDLKELPVLAHSLATKPATAAPLAKLETVTISFAEPTTGAEDPENYRLSGSALGTLKVAGVRQTGKFQYELQLSGQGADGDLVIKMRNITDNVGAALITDSIEYKLDVTPPRVDTSPTNKSALRTLDQMLLQFSEEVTGAGNTENYAISGSGLGTLKPVKIVQDGAAENKYRLSFQGKQGNGEFRLRLKNISDRAENPLEAGDIVYTIDTISPTVVVSPAPNLLLRELSNIELNFSEAVAGAGNRENYVISGTGAGDLRVHEIIRADGGRYRLKLNGSPTNGNISIQIANVTDMAGNTLQGGTFAYQSDVQWPELRAMPVPGTPLSRLTAIEIEFSEPVSGAGDLRNYLLEGDGAGNLALQKIQKLSNTRYALRLAGTPGNGKILLRLTNMTDAAGNPLRIDTLEYPADTTPPRYKTSLPPGSVVNAIKEIDLEFSEPVVGADRPEKYALSGEGAEKLTIAAVTALQGNVYRVSLSGTLKNGRIVLQLKNISDPAGNPLATGAMEYLADINPPELQKISPAAGATLRALSEIELQFSEPVTGADNAQNYLLSGEGLGSLSITAAQKMPGNKVRLTLKGKPGEGKLSLRWNNLSDRAQNQPTTQAVDFRLDSHGPVFQADLPAGIAIAELRTMTLRYSEAVTGAEHAQNYRVSGAGAGSLSVKSVVATKSGMYVIHFAGSPVDGDVTLRIVNVTDSAGNPLQDDSLTFKTDVSPPNFTFSPPEENPLSRLDEILFAFSEPVFGAERIENYLLAGEGIGGLKIGGIETLPGNKFKISLSGKPGNGKVFLQLGAVTDAAGNKARKEKLAYQADTTPPSFKANPESGSLAKEFSRIDIVYSKPVLGGGDKKNYVLSGDGVGSLAIDRVTQVNATQFRILLTGNPQSGTIQLAMTNIADLAGNPLPPNPVVYHSDTLKPTMIVQPPTEAPLNRLPEITLRFSKPVFGANNKANYKLTGEGVGSLRLEKIVKGQTEDYVLAFSGAAAHGDVRLNIGEILDAAGNSPETTSVQYRIDLRPVEVQARPANKSKLESLREIELKFSEEATGAEEPGNYSIAGENAESLAISTVENRGKNIYVLRLSGEGAGPIQILLKNIKDLAGNDLKNNRLDYILEIPTASQPCGDIVR